MAGGTSKRGYDNSLREEQAQATRERILDAMTKQLAEAGYKEFSVAQLAKRAGVSEPTIYRHFGGREGLFEAFSEWFERHGGHPGSPNDAEEFIEAGVDRVFAYFAEHEPYIRASQNSELAEVMQPGRRKRRKKFDKLLVPMTEHLEPREGKQVRAIFMYLISARAFIVLKDELGLSTEEATAAVNWAMRTLAQPLRAAKTERKAKGRQS